MRKPKFFLHYQLDLIRAPNSILNQKCLPIQGANGISSDAKNSDDVFFQPILNFEPLFDFMTEIIEKTEAVGLAANQCGVPFRCFLMRRFYLIEDQKTGVQFEPRGSILTVLNPEILSVDTEESIFKEGCLSFPGKTADVTRPRRIKVTYFDENGKFWCEILEGLEAVIFQHELDHLNGITMFDRWR